MGDKEVLVGLRVSNIIMNGKLPFKHKPRESELKALIERSNLQWDLANEEVTPLLIVYFDKTYISVLSSGSVYMAGLKSIEEGHKYFQTILNDLKKNCPRLFED